MQERPYQNRAIDFLLREGKGIVRGPTGCGKTFIALSAARRLGWERLLIAVPRYSALLAWKRELERLGVPHTIIQKWPPTKRREFWQHVEPSEADGTHVVVCLYQTAIKDVDLLTSPRSRIDFVICDECHRLKDRRIKTFKAMRSIVRGRKRFFLSATLQARGPEDLWSPLHMVQPKGFPSYWEFIKRYCILEDDEYGTKVVGVKQSTLSELRFKTRAYIHNISTKEVDGFVPKRNRQRLSVELSPRVRAVYKSLWRDSMVSLPGSAPLLAPGTLAKFVAVRKLLTCPALIHEAFGVGDALETVREHALGEAPNPHCVIFSDFKEPFPLWQSWLEDKGAHVTILQGGMRDTDLKIAIDTFSRLSDKRESWLLCTIPYAESFDLLSPQTAYMIGFSWDQIANYQAEGRLTRGSKEYANFFYTVHEHTVDTHVLDVLDTKVQNTSLVVSDLTDSEGKL